MKGSRVMAAAIVAGLGLSTLAPTAACAFDASGFAGGLLGGMIGGAIAGGGRPRPVIVYRPRTVYRVVRPRYAAHRYAAASHASHGAASRASSAAVVNPAADPFATTKPSGPVPIPVANKP